MIDDLAAVLWRTSAKVWGAPQSVIDNRTREAFDDKSEDTKNHWREFARAAIVFIAESPDV